MLLISVCAKPPQEHKGSSRDLYLVCLMVSVCLVRNISMASLYSPTRHMSLLTVGPSVEVGEL